MKVINGVKKYFDVFILGDLRRHKDIFTFTFQQVPVRYQSHFIVMKMD